MRLTLIVVVLGLTLTSCADDSQNSQDDAIQRGKTKQEKLFASLTHSTSQDTLVIDRPAAVFVEPDSLGIEKRKKEVDEENFYAVVGMRRWQEA